MKPQKILITGANGQLGTVLTSALAAHYGKGSVLATDIWQDHPHGDIAYEKLDIMNAEAIQHTIERYQITQVYHLAAILSASGENNPLETWRVNMQGYMNILEACRIKQIERLFYPSSIAVFGQMTPHEKTPQLSPLDPRTVYGISKAAGEYWSQYYFDHFKLDVRSLRYPGIISYQSKPGGGTTDYAVEIFHDAVQNDFYTCFLKEDTALPMIYMDDAIRATIELMNAPIENIKQRLAYNLSGLSFTPAELAKAIQQHIHAFNIQYSPDNRQKIADSWPSSIDDSAARADWGWEPTFDLEKLTKIMIYQLQKRYAAESNTI